MIKRYLEKLDRRYVKICVYAAVTVLVTLCAAWILMSTGSFWTKIWSIFTSVLKPVIIGGIICYLLLPAVNRFEALFNREKEHKWARGAGVLLTFLILAVLILLVLGMIVLSVYKNVGAINPASITDTISGLSEEYADVWKFMAEKLESMNVSTDSFSSVVKTAAEAAKSFVSGLLFGVIFSVYFLLDKENRIFAYWKHAFSLMFGNSREEQFDTFVKDADHAFSGYIRGQLVDASIVGVLVAVALSVAGIPYSLIIGLITGLGNLIPYLGPVLGYVVTVIVCLPSGAFDKMLIGLAIIAVMMFVDANIINPKLLSDNVDVHPLLVVAALIGGGAIGGIAGMLVAVPSAALIKTQFDRYLEKLEKEKESAG